ncbi:MAG: Fe-S cluster assembly protein SufD [Alphaproteobacteria bacterium]|nr:Fe-S cluster assembly protein SufD [Alphaproteobacteria bacterium]
MSTALQPTAAEQALGVSLPSRRMEDWRWTDLRARINKPYPPQKVQAPARDVERLLAASPFAKIAKARVVFVNGALDEKHSRLSGLNIGPVDAKLKITDPVIALNSTLKAEGVRLKFSETQDQPVEIIHITTDAAPRALAVHNRIEVADGASAFVIETFLGEGDYVLNAVTEIAVGKGAHLDRLKLQDDSSASTHLAQSIYELEEASRLNDVLVLKGSALTRQNGTLAFNGQHAEAKISGAYLLKGKQHCDTALVINHNVPHCTSRELFKCVMDDDARGIFQGKVVVARDAQKTDGKQSSHALLLSERAEFDAKPELEIYADDVVCGHGATAGDLNHDHMFYLKSRGIPEAEAKALLIAAFVGEAFDMVANDELRAALAGLAESWVVNK